MCPEPTIAMATNEAWADGCRDRPSTPTSMYDFRLRRPLLRPERSRDMLNRLWLSEYPSRQARSLRQSGPNATLARVPIDRETLVAHIEEHGPFLYHVTNADNREAILNRGLCPGSELGHFVRDDFFRTRAGHVYLCDRRRGVPVVRVDGERLTLQVDLRLLDPACFDTDEDVPHNQQRFQAKKWFNVEPPRRQMLDQETEAPAQAGRLADWAESIAEFDEPRFAARSLAAGRVAYQGTIAPVALEVVELPSEGVEVFANRAQDQLGRHIGVVPSLSLDLVEVKRVRVIAQSVLDAGLEMLSQPSLTVEADVSDPLRAHHLDERLRRFGFQQNRAGRSEPRDVAFALADLAKAVAHFEPALGWDPDACLAIAEHAASILTTMATTAGHEMAVSIARSAVSSAGRI
jgi:hypothetical protein